MATSSRLQLNGKKTSGNSAAGSWRHVNLSKLSLLGCLLWIARIILLATTSYAAWRFGGTEIVVLWHVGLSVCVLLGMLACGVACFGWKPEKPDTVFILLPLLFVAFGAIQAVGVPEIAKPLFPYLNQINQEFGVTPASKLQQAAASLGNESNSLQTIGTASLIPQSTRIALVPIALAIVIGWIAAILFNTPKSRRLLLWWLALHTAALAVWGIVQRAGGSGELLPGIAYTGDGMPFASFVYRNAGAAAILPGFAAIAALLCKRRRGTYETAPRIISIQDLTLYVLAGLLIVATAISLSRGAWIAAATACAIGLFASKPKVSLGRFSIAALMFITIAAIGGIQFNRELQSRWSRVSLAAFSTEDRLEHWQDGLRTAWKYSPFGSGLGTYGYSTLAEQTTPRDDWFREAHNQFLELFTETGCIGLLLVLAMAALLTKVSLAHYHRGQSTDRRSIGIFGLMILSLAIIQNAFDFVIMLPGNLMLYGLLVGILITGTFAQAGPAVLLRSRSKHPLGGVALLSLALAITVVSLQISSRQLVGDRAIAQSPLRDLADAIDDELLAQRIAILDAAIEVQPDRAVLYRHRAAYVLARYRHQIILAGSRIGENISWQNTQPETLFSILAALPESARNLTLRSLVETPNLRKPLALALRDSSASLCCNPLFYQVHWTAALLAPLTGASVKDSLAHASRLSKSDAEKMYSTGLLAYLDNDNEIMRRQWSDCLLATRQYEKSVFEFLLRRMSAPEIAMEVVPPARPEILVSLVQTVLTRDVAKGTKSSEKANRVALQIAETINTASHIPDGSRHTVLATIYDLLEDYEKSSVHWVAAVESSPENPHLRKKAAISLRSHGDLNQALRHAILGNTLSPSDTQFRQVTSSIRAQMARSSH